MTRWLIVILCSLVALTAHAQQVIQSGKPVPGHPSKWITNGVVGDAGPANGGPAGAGMTELNITGHNNASTPLGTAFCMNDGPITGPYHQLCFDPNAQGGGLVTYNPYGGAPPLPLNCQVNGITSTCFASPGPTGPTGPPGPGAPHVANLTAQMAYSTVTDTIIRDGFAASGDGGGATYTLKNSSCSLNDGGSQVPFSGGGKCWVLQLAATPNPMIWGADLTGAADSSTAVQAMVNYACSSPATNYTGNRLYLPPGKIKFHDISVPCPGVHIFGSEIGSTGFGGPASSGTQVDCSGMSLFCVRFRPQNFPAPSQMDGGSVENVTFTTTNRVGTILEFDQIRSPRVSRVAIWNALNGIKIFGSIAGVISDVQGWFISGVWIEGTGDLSGPGCTLANCATRSDSLLLQNIVAGDGGHTATGYLFDNQMFTVQTNNIQFEQGAYGMRVLCSGGQPNLGYCPQHILNSALNLEFAAAPLSILDFTDFRCAGCYIAGQDITNTEHTAFFALQNYPPALGAGGGVVISDSQIYNAHGSCVWVAVSDSTITGSTIQWCNSEGTGAGIEFVNYTRHKISNNTFCNYLAAIPPNMIGYRIDAPAFEVQDSGNSFEGCLLHKEDFNQSGFNYEVNSLPPPGPPTLTVGSGGNGVGTGGTVVLQPGSNDRAGYILLTVASPGTGAAAQGAINLNFHEAMFPGASCQVSFERGTNVWASNSTWTNGGVGTSPSIFEIDWSNGGLALVTGGYFLHYNCAPGYAGSG